MFFFVRDDTPRVELFTERFQEQNLTRLATSFPDQHEPDLTTDPYTLQFVDADTQDGMSVIASALVNRPKPEEPTLNQFNCMRGSVGFMASNIVHRGPRPPNHKCEDCKDMEVCLVRGVGFATMGPTYALKYDLLDQPRSYHTIANLFGIHSEQLFDEVIQLR